MGTSKKPVLAATPRAPPSAPQNSTSLKTTNALPLSASLPTPSPSPEPASLKITAATSPSPPPSAKPRTKAKNSTTSPSATSPTSTPEMHKKTTSRTTGHKLSLTLNITLLALLLSAPLTFPAAISTAREVDIPAWQTLYTSAQSDPARFAHEKYTDAVSWIGRLTQPGLSAQQEAWAREEAEAEARRKGLVDALSDVIKGAKKKKDPADDKAKAKETRSGVKYTKAKSGDKEWRREKPEPVEAGTPRNGDTAARSDVEDKAASTKTAPASSSSATTSASTAVAATSSPSTAKEATTDNIDNTDDLSSEAKSLPKSAPPKDQPIGDTIADIIAAFQQNKPKRDTSGAEKLLSVAHKGEKSSSSSKGSSLTKEQQDLADSVAGLIGFFGKVMTDTSSNTAAKTARDDNEIPDIEADSNGAVADVDTSSPAEPVELLRPSGESGSTVHIIAQDTAEDAIEPVSTNLDNDELSGKNKNKANKPKSPTAPAAEAVGDILNLLSKLNSGALTKKEPANSPSSSKPTQPNPAADLLGMLGQFAAGTANKKTPGSSGNAGAGGLDLAGILGSLVAASGNKQKLSSSSSSTATTSGSGGGGGGGGLDLVGILGALASTSTNKQRGSSSSSSSSASSGAGGGLDFVNILSSLATAANSNNNHKNTRAGTAAGAGGGTPLPAGVDINSAFKMLKMVNAFQGLGKTFADIGSQADGSDSVRGKTPGGGADAAADMMGAGLEALSFFGKVMANMPQQQQAEAAKAVERVGLELDGAPAEEV